MKDNLKIDIVGSFLPPESLIKARRDHNEGNIDSDRLNAIENNAISDIVERQLEIGLSEVTSGEYRRTYWDKDFYFGLEGISKVNYSSGHVYQDVESGTDLIRVTGRIAFNPAHPFFDDFSFLYATASRRAVCRQTLPSPANLFIELLSMTGGHPERIYPTPETLLEDIAMAYNDTIRHFHGLGCRSLQFDDTACGLLCQDNFTKRLLQGGIDLVALHEDIISLVNESVAGLPSDIEFSMYLSGGDVIVPEWEFLTFPDNIMPKILSRADVSGFFLPMDTDNDYQLEVLRHIPSGKKITLGLMDAHSPFSTDPSGISRTVAEVSRIFPGRLTAISPRTGFKLSSYLMRGLGYDTQWQKLEELEAALCCGVATD